MVLQATTQHTSAAEAFDRFVQLPENADKSFEYIAGEICEVVSNNYSSEIAALILYFIQAHLRQHHLVGRVTGADGGYVVCGERYIPDVAFVSAQKQPRPSHDAYNPNPPDLAVEVLSPGNTDHKMRVKIVNYLHAGTTVWVVNPDDKCVECYVPNHPPQTLSIDDTLSGGDTLPGFQLATKDIFPSEESQDE